jgi:hypothetical protein
MTPEAAVCLDPAVMAFAMRDAGPRLGDTVAVFGLGAIGLMCLQLAKLGGAATVVGVDLLENRRALAAAYGADVVLDPRESGDAGLAIRRLTGAGESVTEWAPGPRLLGGYREDPTQVGERGVDLAVETSGSTAPSTTRSGPPFRRYGLPDLLLRRGGGRALPRRRVPRQPAEPDLLPRPEPADARPSGLDPGPLRGDLRGVAADRDAADGRADLARRPLCEAVEAYREIDEHPERSIKLGVAF